jgi:serine/threonine-protein kinase PknK
VTDDGRPEGRATFGDFEDLREIGRGGFAVVYLAAQKRFGRQVALKVLDPGADALALERFERECEAMGRLSSHPNIVTIFDAGVTDAGLPYLVMEHMAGGSLDDRLDRQGPRPWQEVVDIGVKLCGAIETAHRATILHRDVKPANVLVSSFGEPCLSDFGLARFGGQAKTTGVVTATLMHAPPEVLEGSSPTPQSDVYSLGSTLYTLVAGQAPFWRDSDENLLALIARIADQPVPDLDGDIPEPVRAALEAAMAKDPADRPASAADLGRRLQAAQSVSGVATTPLRLGDDAEIAAAAEEMAAAPTDPNVTVPRRGAPGDDGDRTVKRGHTPVLTPPPPATGPAPTRRRRWLGALMVLLVLAVAAGAFLLLTGGGDDDPSGPSEAGSETGTPTDPDADATKADLVDEVNAHRARQDLDPVTVDRQLAREAQASADTAAEQGEFPPLDLTISDRHDGRWFVVVSAAIAGGSAAEAQQNAFDSPTTEPNLVKSNTDVIGVGLATSEDGETTYLVEYLAQRN